MYGDNRKKYPHLRASVMDFLRYYICNEMSGKQLLKLATGKNIEKIFK